MGANTPDFIIALSRPIEVFNDNSSDLDNMSVEELKEVVIELKKRELKWDVKANQLSNLLEEVYDFIRLGANIHSNLERVELEDKIKKSLGI